MPERKRLSRHDWAAAALDAVAEGGISAVAVEPIATRLGTTKGSFYWHFRNRDALVEAALELWERRNTSDIIERAATTGPDARTALRSLMGTVLASVTAAPGGAGPPDGPAAAAARGHAVEVALQADDRHPSVAAALDRVSRRRLEHLTVLFSGIGFDADTAHRRALLAFTAYLGHVRLGRATPSLVPRGADLDAYLDEMLAALTAGPSTP